MKQPPTNICPLLAIASIGTSSGPAECIMDSCTWWSDAANECAIVALVERSGDADGD